MQIEQGVALLNKAVYRCASFILATGLIWSCGQSPEDGPGVGAELRDSISRQEDVGALANGERIFRSATSRSRPIVSSTGATRPDGKPLSSCADCHGSRGEGGLAAVGGKRLAAPAIHYPALTRERETAGLPSYTEVTFGLTLRTGVTPDGRKLDPMMPRWQMTAQDQKDLYLYLQSMSPSNSDASAR